MSFNLNFIPEENKKSYIYVVSIFNYDWCSISKAFFSEEKAKEYKKVLENEWSRDTDIQIDKVEVEF